MTARMAAAIVLMLGAGTAAGAELGRLFFTPAQRATLDIMREKNIGMEAASDKELAPPAPQNVSLDGVVRRSDGKNTVWLNNRAVSGRQADGINVATGKNDNRVKLTIPESGRSIDLKVGQTADIVSGTIAESHAPRRAPPPKPEAKAAPGAESTASGTAKATPPAASRPAASEGSARNAAARAREPDAEDGIRPKRVGEAK